LAFQILVVVPASLVSLLVAVAKKKWRAASFFGTVFIASLLLYMRTGCESYSCQNCRKKEATVHLTSFGQGGEKLLRADLCDKCAEALQILAVMREELVKRRPRKVRRKRPTKTQTRR
jgi:hypothetical protein